MQVSHIINFCTFCLIMPALFKCLMLKLIDVFRDVCALRRCVVKELEKCSEPTPANIIQSMFDFVLKVTPCSSCKAEQLRNPVGSSSSRTKLDYVSLVLNVLFVFITLH